MNAVGYCLQNVYCVLSKKIVGIVYVLFQYTKDLVASRQCLELVVKRKTYIIIHVHCTCTYIMFSYMSTNNMYVSLLYQE